jgi:hypothetical protein
MPWQRTLMTMQTRFAWPKKIIPSVIKEDAFTFQHFSISHLPEDKMGKTQFPKNKSGDLRMDPCPRNWTIKYLKDLLIRQLIYSCHQNIIFENKTYTSMIPIL